MIHTNVEVFLWLELTLREHNQYHMLTAQHILWYVLDMFFCLNTCLTENTLYNHGNHSRWTVSSLFLSVSQRTWQITTATIVTAHEWPWCRNPLAWPHFGGYVLHNTPHNHPNISTKIPVSNAKLQLPNTHFCSLCRFADSLMNTAIEWLMNQ
jgi:hypothetical protein